MHLSIRGYHVVHMPICPQPTFYRRLFVVIEIETAIYEKKRWISVVCEVERDGLVGQEAVADEGVETPEIFPPY